MSNTRLKILLLTPRFPFPPIGGDKLRVFYILKHLHNRHDISLVCFSDQPVTPDIIHKYSHLFSSIDVIVLPKVQSYISCMWSLFSKRPLQVSYYQTKRMTNLIENKCRNTNFDLIFVHLIRMAEYVKKFPTFKILDMTDAQSLNYRRSLKRRKGLWSLINKTEKARVQHYEQVIWRYFDETLVVSSVDLEYFKTFDQEMKVSLLRNGVDIAKYKYSPPTHSHQKICFIGNMRTFPNTDAVMWFSNAILPIIRNKYPNVQFQIIGTEPSRRVKKLNRLPGVTVTGQVSDITKYVHDSLVSVAPMRVGAGIQNKILESMALGTPVVTSPMGLEGLECKPGKDVLVADSPSEFADAVTTLFHNPGLRQMISRNARIFVEREYVWDKVLKKLDIIIQNRPHRPR